MLPENIPYPPLTVNINNMWNVFLDHVTHTNSVTDTAGVQNKTLSSVLSLITPKR